MTWNIRCRPPDRARQHGTVAAVHPDSPSDGGTKRRRCECNRANPCPVCGGTSTGCNVENYGDTPGLTFCRKREGPQPGFVCLKEAKGDRQWTLYRREDDPYILERQRRREVERRAGRSTAPSNGHGIDWTAKVNRAVANLTPAGRAELAAELGVPESVLSTMRIGFVPRGPHKKKNFGPAYTFPEVDASGRIVGITCRYGDGEKLAWPGGRHGLFVPDGWREREGPVYLVEGASDVLALTALGKAVIGRPSNMAGVDLLGKLLKNLPSDRPIVVLGEQDEKRNGKWPGRDGAWWTSRRLTETLGRRVPWSFPPGDAKDVRSWCQSKLRPDSGSDAWSVAGEEFVAGLDDNDPPKDAEEPDQEPEQPRFQFIDAVDFLAGDYRQEFFIPRVLASHQPGVIGGPSKGLKTSIALDGAVSLATATPFLGKFPVPKRRRVAVVSGESGRYAICNAIHRILTARGLDPSALERGWFNLEFTLPTFTDAPTMSAFADALAELQAEVVIIDPVYLALGDADAKSLFEMGRALRPVAETLLQQGATPVLCHHANRMLPVGEPMGLEHLSYAGLAEFSRQWWLVNRHEKWKGDGVSDLWLSVGGSAGHGGQWSVHVEEGVADENGEGRRWDVSVKAATDAVTGEQEARVADRQQKENAQDHKDDDGVMAALDKLDPVAIGASLNTVQVQARLSDARMQRAVHRLVTQRLIRELKVRQEMPRGGSKEVRGLVRIPDE